MERIVVAFSPGHISGYFRRIDGKTPITTGSCGAGLVIDHGVTVTVRPDDHTSVVSINPLPDGNMVIHHGSSLIKGLLDDIGVSAAVKTIADLPTGAGFGMSSAAILATLTAVNAVFNLGFTKCDIAERSHVFEVSHNTGLGDVTAAMGGGLAIRNAPGITGVSMRMFPDSDFCAITLGSIPTPSILGSPEQMRRIFSAFPDREPTNLEEFFQNSRQFAETSGLIPLEIRPILEACDEANVPASMTMLGRGVFAEGRGAYGILAKFGRAIPLKICHHGPIILEM